MRRKSIDTRAQIAAGLITTFDEIFNNRTDHPLTTEEVSKVIDATVEDIERWRKNPYLIDPDAAWTLAAFLGMWPDVIFNLANHQYELEKDKIKAKHKAAYKEDVRALRKAHSE